MKHFITVFAVIGACWVNAVSAQVGSVIKVDLEVMLAQQEAAVVGLADGTEKKIEWAGQPNTKTEYAIVYLHGFSATRQETYPLTNNVAAQLNANLFYTRLAGHGLDGKALAAATKQDWKMDAQEALSIGKQLGEKVILVGVSTGATLITWLVTQDDSAIDAMVMISPNFKPHNSWFHLLQYDTAISVAELVGAGTYSWQPSNEGYAKYWTHSMPLAALQPMASLVAELEDIELADIKTPLLLLYSPTDTVISTEAIAEMYPQFGSEKKQIHTINTDGMVSNHVLAGDILAPDLTPEVERLIMDFINRL